MKKTKKTVLSAMISAASVVVQLIGNVFTTLDLTAAALSGIPLLIIREELGLSYAVLSYITISVLGILLLPQKLIGISFLFFFGIYPIFKSYLEKLPKIISWLLKLLIFNLLFSATIYIGGQVLGIDDPLFAFAIIPYLLGNTTFVLYDIAMTMFISLYFAKYRQSSFIKGIFNK